MIGICVQQATTPVNAEPKYSDIKPTFRFVWIVDSGVGPSSVCGRQRPKHEQHSPHARHHTEQRAAGHASLRCQCETTAACGRPSIIGHELGW